MAKRKYSLLSLLITLLCFFLIEGEDKYEDMSLVWAMKLSKHRKHHEVASEIGLRSHGPISEILDDYHEFRLSHDDHMILRDKLGSHDDVLDHIHSRMKNHADIQWAQLQHSLKRERKIYFNDPSFPLQWHLVNNQEKDHDINVTFVWEMGVTGKGVTVAIVDDGIEHRNKELKDNYNPKGSYDFNDNDKDPSPDTSSLYNSHGTRCAGLVAAVANNKLCGVGVAYNASISGIRLLDGTITDLLEAKSLTHKVHVNHIYSCSWGPTDDGQTVEAPGPLAQLALHLGTQKGRYGYGTVYIFASGNGGNKHDNCNFDGYANSIYTITIGAVDELDRKPYYAEDCSAKVAVTYSNGVRRHDRNIVTSDINRSGSCTTGFSGTSAAAPIAAGVISLALEVRPCLGWRDVYSIVIYTAKPIDFGEADWSINGVGLNHSHQHGFGVLDAYRLVTVAKVWPILPSATIWISPVVFANTPLTNHWTISNVTVLKKDLPRNLVTLEHVTLSITIDHIFRGAIIVDLRSPRGTLSHLATARPSDNSREGLNSWTFTTVRCWGEIPIGNWSLRVRDNTNIGPSSSDSRGKLVRWSLTLYGSNLTTLDVLSRMDLVKRVVNNNSALPPLSCPPHPTNYHDITFPDPTLGSKVLQIISLLASVVVILLLLYLLITYTINKCTKRRNNYLSALPNVPLRRSSSTGDNNEEEAILLRDIDQEDGSKDRL